MRILAWFHMKIWDWDADHLCWSESQWRRSCTRPQLDQSYCVLNKRQKAGCIEVFLYQFTSWWTWWKTWLTKFDWHRQPHLFFWWDQWISKVGLCISGIKVDWLIVLCMMNSINPKKGNSHIKELMNEFGVYYHLKKWINQKFLFLTFQRYKKSTQKAFQHERVGKVLQW